MIEKTKARLVIAGSSFNKEDLGDTASPIVKTETNFPAFKWKGKGKGKGKFFFSTFAFQTIMSL